MEDAVDARTGKSYLPPCQIGCPIGEDIQRTNMLIASLPRDIRDAYLAIVRIGDEIYEKNPLFPVCGYICGLCEKECNYKDKGGAVRRRLLKKFISDYYVKHLETREKLTLYNANTRVAVIGGGPAGLMCTYELARKGYKVTLFDRSHQLGGAIRLIPKYRLPWDILDKTINTLLRISDCNTNLGSEVKDLAELRNQGFKAIFIATGTPNPRPLTFEGKPVAGTDMEGVFQGIEFLWEVNRGKLPKDLFKGKKVITIGGGNVAFDVARTARRLGGTVEIVCLECEDKSNKDGIPADLEEIEGAHEEGIKINYSRGVSEVTGKDGKFMKIKCPRCISVFDEKGFNPKFNNSDFIYLEGDILLIAIGQFPDRAFYQKNRLLDEKGRMVVDPVTLQSLVNDVFIGGDVKKIGFAAEAMRDGIIAAESIDRFIKGEDLKKGRDKRPEKTEMPRVSLFKEAVNIAYFRSKDRLKSFEPVEKGYDLGEAIREAKRCLCCGPCSVCKGCIVLGIQSEIPQIEINKDKCSGCAVCLLMCSYTAIKLEEVEKGKFVSVTDDLKCKRCGLCVSGCPSAARKIQDELETRKNETYRTLSLPTI